MHEIEPDEDFKQDKSVAQDAVPTVEKKLSRSERSPVRWHYEQLGTKVAAGILLVALAGITAQHVVENGRRSIATEIDGATDKATVFFDETKAGFEATKERVDKAEEQCRVIKRIAPKISAIAEVIGATPPSASTTTTLVEQQIATAGPNSTTSTP